MAGRTVTRRLSAPEALLYQEWIAYVRQLHAIVDEMRAVADEARGLILGAPQPTERDSA